MYKRIDCEEVSVIESKLSKPGKNMDWDIMWELSCNLKQ